MAVLTETTEAALLPETWGPRFIAALYDEMAFAPRCLNITGDYKGVGDIAHIAVQSTAYTVGNVSSTDHTFTPQANTMTDATVTINQRRITAIEPGKYVEAMTFAERFNDFPENAGNALREDIDNQLLALYASITQTTGDGTGNIGQDELLDAIRQLGTTPKLPILSKPDEFTYVIHMRQMPQLKKSGLMDFNRTGLVGEGGAAKIGLPSIFQIPIVFTTQVAANGTIHENVLAHKTSFAWASLKMPIFEKASGTGAKVLTDVLAVWTLFGVNVVVANRSVRLRSATT